MERNPSAFLVICIAAVLLAGCTTDTHPPAASVTTAITPTPSVMVVPENAQACRTDGDCVPAECCHPASCINHAVKTVCTVMCTMSCEGPLDCGAGSCGCVNGTCSVVSAHPAISPGSIPTSLHLMVSPQRYSPLMSSTVGVGMEVNATGFDPGHARFAWNATFGKFLSWGPADYTVKERGNPVTNSGEKLYWSFSKKPVSTLEPVIITVTATDPASGKVLGTSRVILAWDGDFAVMVTDFQY